MDIWIVGTLNKLFIKGFMLKPIYQINKQVSGKTLLFVVGQFCTSRSICLSNGFRQKAGQFRYFIVFSNIVPSTKILQSSFLKKDFLFLDNLFHCY